MNETWNFKNKCIKCNMLLICNRCLNIKIIHGNIQCNKKALCLHCMRSSWLEEKKRNGNCIHCSISFRL